MNKLEKKRSLNFFINKIYHFFFSEKFFKTIPIEFDNSKNRIDLIKEVIKIKKYKSYLEIGCDQNQVFNNVSINYKIGVDPQSGGNFRGTSDKFFLTNKKKFDLIFIDGLHVYDQVIKDIENALKFLNDDGTILMHDCLPINAKYQFVPRSRYKWNGDVWKAVVLYRTKKDLDICTGVFDQGISVIKKRNNTQLLNDRISSYKNLKFKYLYKNYNKIMRLKNFSQVLEFV